MRRTLDSLRVDNPYLMVGQTPARASPNGNTRQIQIGPRMHQKEAMKGTELKCRNSSRKSSLSRKNSSPNYEQRSANFLKLKSLLKSTRFQGNGVQYTA